MRRQATNTKHNCRPSQTRLPCSRRRCVCVAVCVAGIFFLHMADFEIFKICHFFSSIFTIFYFSKICFCGVSATFSRAENTPKQSEITLAARHKTNEHRVHVSKEHRVHAFRIYSCTICCLRKFRVLGGDVTCEALWSHHNLLKRIIAMGKCDGIL